MINLLRFPFAKTNSIRSIVFIVFRDQLVYHISKLLDFSFSVDLRLYISHSALPVKDMKTFLDLLSMRMFPMYFITALSIVVLYVSKVKIIPKSSSLSHFFSPNRHFVSLH